MGQVFVPSIKDIILTDVDRLVARNADGGLSPSASHVILLGESAGRNLGDVDNVIALGFNSAGGGIADPAFEGLTVLGEQSLTGAVADSSIVPVAGTFTTIGFRAAQNLLFGSSSVIIGDNALQNPLGANNGPIQRMVVIGSGAARNLFLDGSTSASSATIIGQGAAVQAVDGDAFNRCAFTAATIIGARACGAVVSGGAGGFSFGNSVIIGESACRLAGAVGALTSNVIVGQGAGQSMTQGTGNVAIGQGTLAVGRVDNSVVIGESSGSAGQIGSRNVLIGGQIKAPAVAGVDGRNIMLGVGANNANVTMQDALLVETFDGVTVRTTLYGRGGSGALTGIVIGHSTDGVNRDLPGTNLLKVLNGTVTGVAPVGGGFFYSVAGELHWVSSGNFDYALTPAASLGNFTVATLPAAPALGAKAYATDALAPAFGAAVAGGGAVFIPVFWNGAAWIVG